MANNKKFKNNDFNYQNSGTSTPTENEYFDAVDNEGFTFTPYNPNETQPTPNSTTSTQQQQQSNSTPTPSNYYDVDEDTQKYYQLAKNQQYSQLLDTELVLAQARDRANKYAKNVMANQGYSGSGYASSNAVAMQNAYLNALGNAQNQYNQNMTDIGQQEILAKQESNENQLRNDMATISESQSTDELNNAMVDMGLAYVDGNGSINLQKPSDMSNSDWQQMKKLYEDYYTSLQNIEFDNSHSTQVSVDNFEKDIANYTYEGKGGKIKNFKSSYFKDAGKVLSHDVRNGKIKDGDYIAMSGDKGFNLYFVYRNGTLYRVSRNTYNTSKNKHSYSYKDRMVRDY